MKKGNVVSLLATLCGITLLAGGGLAHGADKRSYLRPEAVPAPADNAPTKERVELGKKLFFDPRLSGSNWISCATCHNPALGWSDGLPTAIGHNMKILGRATPTVLNTAYQKSQFWDGRAATLEEQAVGPIQAPGEMNQSMVGAISKIAAIPGYRELFDKAYPGEGVTERSIAKAIASFERTVVSGESPFDRWAKGNEKAVSDAAKRGFAVFEGKGRCAVCHSGFNFTDDGFHNVGLKQAGEPDLGRFNVRKVKTNRGAFKTPTLRDVDRTAPYMHNGAYKTLEEVVEHYDRGGDVKEDLSPNMQPLQLTAQEKSDLVAFLKSLTGDPSEITVPRLP